MAPCVTGAKKEMKNVRMMWRRTKKKKNKTDEEPGKNYEKDDGRKKGGS